MEGPNSPVELINIALGNLGVPVITSIDPPNGTTAQIAASRYVLARQCVLRMGVWNFAKRRTMISRTGTPEFDWDDKYLIPADCIRILSLQGEDERAQIQNYDIEGREVMLNASGATSIKLRYVIDVPDLSLWGPDAKDVLAWYLTTSMAYPLTRSKEVAAWANGMLAAVLPDAKSVDGQERPPLVIEESRTLTERMSLGSTGLAGPYFTVD